MASKSTSEEKFLNASLIDGKENFRLSKKQSTGQRLWENWRTDFKGFFKWLSPQFNTPPLSTQLQSDWTETDVNSVRFIRHKPVQYNKYVALLTQTGTDAPVATIIENGVGNIVWNYIGVGQYTAVLMGAFPETKTWYSLTITDTFEYDFFRNDDDTLGLNVSQRTTDLTPGNPVQYPAIDGRLFNTPIEIRVKVSP